MSGCGPQMGYHSDGEDGGGERGKQLEEIITDIAIQQSFLEVDFLHPSSKARSNDQEFHPVELFGEGRPQPSYGRGRSGHARQ